MALSRRAALHDIGRARDRRTDRRGVAWRDDLRRDANRQATFRAHAVGTMTFHHLGIAERVVLDGDARAYAALGYEPEGSEFVDEIQGVRGLFLIGGGPRLELLEPLPGTDTLAPILRRGVKCYHHGYEVRSLGESLAELRRGGAQVVVRGQGRRLRLPAGRLPDAAQHVDGRADRGQAW